VYIRQPVQKASEWAAKLLVHAGSVSSRTDRHSLLNAWEPVGACIDGSNMDDRLGSLVAVSEDGKIIAVGAKQYAWVLGFDVPSQTWKQINSNIQGDLTYISVAPSADGQTIVIGMAGSINVSGKIRLFHLDASSEWIQMGNYFYVTAPGEQLGI
jgi:hypothetical protein